MVLSDRQRIIIRSARFGSGGTGPAPGPATVGPSAEVTIPGATIEAIKQRFGHSSIRVTSGGYGSLLPTVDVSITAAFEARFGSQVGNARGEDVVNGAVGTLDRELENGETAGRESGGDGT